MRCKEFQNTPDWCTKEANNEGYGWCDQHQLYHFIYAAEKRAEVLGIPVAEMLAREWLGGPIKLPGEEV